MGAPKGGGKKDENILDPAGVFSDPGGFLADPFRQPRETAQANFGDFDLIGGPSGEKRTGEFAPEEQERRRIARERQSVLDERAKVLGFADEADRVAKINKIISAFGSTKKGRLAAPFVLTGK